MNKQQQYQALVEINAQSRLLSALSDEISDEVFDIRNKTGKLVEKLGYEERKFQKESIIRYQELLKEKDRIANQQVK